MLGRSYADSVDIDGRVILPAPEQLAGQLRSCHCDRYRGRRPDGEFEEVVEL